MIDQERINLISDPDLPALGVLLDPTVVELLDMVVREADGRCESARVAQVRYVPSKSVVVQYSAEVGWGKGMAATETLVATSGIDLPEGTIRIETEGLSIGVWRYPHDPFLPGLEAAADPERIRRLLERLGAPVAEMARLRRRAYRPGRRAVIEAVTPNARMFLKVVRPDQVADLQAIHSSMAGQVPVPQSYGWSSDLGLVALQAMPGKTLRKALEGRSRRNPEGSQLVALLDLLPNPPAVKSNLPSPLARAPDYARLLSAVVPELADRLDALVEDLQTVAGEPEIPVHGDFHSSQVLTRGPSVVGLIDVDSAGLGARSDDLAGLIGHISTLSLTSSARNVFDRYGADLLADFDQMVEPADLRLRVAAVVLGLATGPFRVQESRWVAQTERRIALAENWVRLGRNPRA